MPAFIQRPTGRVPVESLSPFLREPLKFNCTMDEMVMLDSDRQGCLWRGFGIGKGVTSPSLDVSVFGIPSEFVSGLHGELIQGFGAVDSPKRCYERDHVLGFADFARWVFFSNPENKSGYFGVDFSLIERPTAGVCHTMLRVARIAACCVRHGVSPECELVLLNTRMCEAPCFTDFRRDLHLTSVAQWAASGSSLFGPDGEHCPRCGLKTRSRGLFCVLCGCKPQLILQADENAVLHLNTEL